MLELGFTVAYCDVTHAYANPQAKRDFEQFYHEARRRYGLDEKFIIEGFSRGGFFALSYAIDHPEQIEKIYVDAPVCDLKSWPSEREKRLYGDAVRQWQEAGGDFAEGCDYPIRHFEKIHRAGIPVIVCYGMTDELVPYEENFGRIAERYKRRIYTIAKPDCGHHPHSLDDPKKIVRRLKNGRGDNPLPIRYLQITRAIPLWDGPYLLEKFSVTDYFAASTETLRNSFISFESSRAALRARVPAALLPFST